MNRTLTDFISDLRRSGLVASIHLDEIAARCNRPDAEPKTIAKWIVRNGWLSQFQVKMLWNGRGPELVLGQYELIDKLGEGGMGEVFRARHRRMHRAVALKVIRKEKLSNPEAVRRFQREIQAVAQLSHENVVMAYDADQQGDVHFFAMELVEGVNLARKVREGGPLSLRDACRYVFQAAHGLQHAHERGLVHRDVKPSNLFLSDSGVVKVLDLGLARLDDGEQRPAITREGLVVGTPEFIAPEQARDSRRADARSDIYALGCTLYFLLTGEPPYGGTSPTEKMLKHTTDPIPDITRKRPDVPTTLRAIFEKMIAKSPEIRFQTPVEAAHSLQPFLIESEPTMPPIIDRDYDVELVEPSTGSQFRLQSPDGKVELNPLYQPSSGQSGWFFGLIGVGLIFLVGLVVWLLMR